MTLQKLIDQQRTAVRDAAALGALAVTLRNGVSIEKEEPDVKITSAISVGFRLVAHVHPYDKGTMQYFGSYAVAQEFRAKLFELAQDMKEVWENKTEDLIEEIETRAAELLTPKVTIESNGVNVEVK